MGGPQPPFPKSYLRKPSVGPRELQRELAQSGGPIAVASGDSSGAVTFGAAFPDTTYQLGIEWVSGAPPTQGLGVRGKTVNYCVVAYFGTVVDGSFNWQAWRIGW